MKKFFTLLFLIGAIFTGHAQTAFNDWAATNDAFYAMLKNRGVLTTNGNIMLPITSTLQIGTNGSLGGLAFDSTNGLRLLRNSTGLPVIYILPNGAISGRDLIATTTVSFGGTGNGSVQPTSLSIPSVGTIVLSTNLIVLGSITSTNGVKIGGSGSTITNLVTATASLDFPEIAPGESAEKTVTVTGAKTNDVVSIGLPASLPGSLIYTGYVFGTNTCVVRAQNFTSSAVDPDPATFRIMLTQF